MEDETLYMDLPTLKSMTSSEHQKLMHGEWLQPDPREQRLREIAEIYYTRCDAYDRGVCTERHNGESIPVTPYEQRAVNNHAIQVRRELIATMGITEQEFHEAIKLYNRVRSSSRH